jgi:putative flippase GtrA
MRRLTNGNKLSLSPTVTDWLIRFVLHVLTGFVAVAAHYLVMWGALKMSSPALVATSVGFFTGALVRFFLGYFKVFAPEQNMTQTIPKFVVALGIQGALNAALMQGLLLLSVSVWPAQITVTIALTFFNYLLYRLWVFR